MVFNLNYGPFGSGSWFADKKGWLLEFMASVKAHDQLFGKYAGHIAKAPVQTYKIINMSMTRQ
jgi:hypothetical protein